MNFIKIVDCQNVEHNLNVNFIYNVTEFYPINGQSPITEIHLHYKDEENPFKTFKTDEGITSFLQRLKEHN